MRRVKLILLVLSLGITAPSLAEAGDALVMPYECDLEHGRVLLSPSPSRSYPIVGKREELAVTTCRSQGSDVCRTVMAHRFVISCGAAGVAWMRVAAAIEETEKARAWVEAGRLNVVLAPRKASTAEVSCIDRPTYALGRTASENGSAGTLDCRKTHQDFEHVVLPPGFAPVGELGARLDLDPAGIGVADREHSGRETVTVVAAFPGETVLARTAAGSIEPIVDPIPGLEPYDPNFDTSAKPDKWVTVVRAAADYGIGDRRDGMPSVWPWLLATMALGTAAGLTGVKLHYARAGRRFMADVRVARMLAHFRIERWTARRQTPDTKSYTDSGAAVAPLLEKTKALVMQIKGGGPLREVLLSELEQVRQRLATIEAAASQSEENEFKAAPLYRALVRELERIRRIADGAAASLSRTPRDGAMPATRSEAFAVLGVNPDVSKGVLKKIVDALRMSWHPDHARDESDRLAREARIRQINIAWDLINAKGEPA